MSNPISNETLQAFLEQINGQVPEWLQTYMTQVIERIEAQDFEFPTEIQPILGQLLSAFNGSQLQNLFSSMPTTTNPYNGAALWWYQWINNGDTELEAQITKNEWPFYPNNSLYYLLHTEPDTPTWQRLLHAFRHMEGAPWAIAEICKKWVDTRDPDLEALIIEKKWTAYQPIKARVLTELLTEQAQLLGTLGTRELKIWLEVCEDSNPLIAERAIKVLQNATTGSLDLMAKLWPDVRSPFLLDLFHTKDYLPLRPLETRLMVALKRDDWQTVIKITAQYVIILVRATEYSDKLIAEHACKLLSQLKDRKAQQVLCKYVIDHETPRVMQIALESGFLPAEPHDKALFYFMTGQWDKYEALDFDQRILRNAYATAEPSLRQRLTAKVRAAGRVEYLTAIAGSDYRTRATEINLEEAELLVQILAAKHEWSRLWSLVFDLPLHWSVQAVRLLAQNGWQPTKTEERAMWEQLQPLAFAPLLTNETEFNQALAPAYLRARVRVPGRVNDVAFAPRQPHLAIATNIGKVILWDMQHSKQLTLLDSFAHSIGRVTFTADGRLICGERTPSNDEICNIYGWQSGTPFRLGQHTGTVTALQSVTADLFLSAGRDGQVLLWDAKHSRKLHEFQSAGHYVSNNAWVRGMCLSSDQQQVLLLHQKQIVQVKLPQLEQLKSSQIKGGVPQYGAFAPDSKSLAIWQAKGRLSSFAFDSKGNINELGEGFGNYKLLQQVQGLASLPQLNLLAIATADGQVSFSDWSTRQITGQINAPGKRLTSLKLSPDNYFMALGDTDASFSLWDLRALELQRLVARPLAQGKAVHMAALAMVRESEPNITPELEAALCFIELILRYRFRHDIELAEDLPSIQTGQFDIEIEG